MRHRQVVISFLAAVRRSQNDREVDIPSLPELRLGVGRRCCRSPLTRVSAGCLFLCATRTFRSSFCLLARYERLASVRALVNYTVSPSSCIYKYKRTFFTSFAVRALRTLFALPNTPEHARVNSPSITSTGESIFVSDNTPHVSQWVIIQWWIRHRNRIRVIMFAVQPSSSIRQRHPVVTYVCDVRGYHIYWIICICIVVCNSSSFRVIIILIIIIIKCWAPYG